MTLLPVSSEEPLILMSPLILAAPLGLLPVNRTQMVAGRFLTSRDDEYSPASAELTSKPCGAVRWAPSATPEIVNCLAAEGLPDAVEKPVNFTGVAPNTPALPSAPAIWPTMVFRPSEPVDDGIIWPIPCAWAFTAPPISRRPRNAIKRVCLFIIKNTSLVDNGFERRK